MPLSVDCRRALLCEDDGVSLVYFRKVLQTAGIVQVDEARDGERALILALEHRPDLILIDAALTGLESLELSRRIAAIYRPCIVLIDGVSGTDDVENRLDAAAAGVAGCIARPVAKVQLLADIESIWNEWTSQA